jgi:hypothetical protein
MAQHRKKKLSPIAAEEREEPSLPLPSKRGDGPGLPTISEDSKSAQLSPALTSSDTPKLKSLSGSKAGAAPPLPDTKAKKPPTLPPVDPGKLKTPSSSVAGGPPPLPDTKPKEPSALPSFDSPKTKSRLGSEASKPSPGPDKKAKEPPTLPSSDSAKPKPTSSKAGEPPPVPDTKAKEPPILPSVDFGKLKAPSTSKAGEPPLLPDTKAKEPPTLASVDSGKLKAPSSSKPSKPSSLLDTIAKGAPAMAGSEGKPPSALSSDLKVSPPVGVDAVKPLGATTDEKTEVESAPQQPSDLSPDSQPDTPSRRVARRRPTGPVRQRVAANDDAPSMGGLIYALQQKPSSKPYKIAGIASLIWGAIGIAFTIVMIASRSDGLSIIQTLIQPATFLAIVAIIVPIAVLWFMALLAWRAEELRLRSSTMTEVALRLAEPERMAEESIVSLGQAVRRQVSFMNDAVSRALGRAGELEALVHNEVAVLERSYEGNESKIRNLIQELSGERQALVTTSDQVSGTLRDLGTEIPSLIDKLSNQQVKLSQIIQGAGDNLTALESTIATSVGTLETSLGGGTEQLQNVLENYTVALAGALNNRSEQMQQTFESYMEVFDTSLANRTENLQTVFEEYARALDATLARRSEALDYQLVERTKSLDNAFTERLRLFDESIIRSTSAIDAAVEDKAKALTTALDSHAITFRETIGKQSADLDEALMHGINSVRRSSENISRQSIKAMEGLASQSDLLKSVSENMLTQINSVTSRFESQGQTIMNAANSLEGANFKIDSTLRNRHAELSQTLDRLSGKADEFGNFLEGYSSSIEGSLSEAESRTRGQLERIRTEASAEGERALEDIKKRLTSVSSEMTSELGSLTSQVATSSEELRQQAAHAAEQVAAEQARLKQQMEQLPATTQESAETMRRALQDQLNALDQLSHLTSRTATQRDVSPPIQIEGESMTQAAPASTNGTKPRHPENTRALSSLSSTIAKEMSTLPQQKRPNSGGPKKRSRGSGDAREGWSLGDLLDRASRDEEGSPQPTGAPQQAPPFNLNLPAMARALDAATAAAIWSRLRAGHRGVMARSIYGNEGRALFDEVSNRCQTDPKLAQTIGRYLADFERAISESDLGDTSGRLTQSHLISDTGRVYLFMAHACGRLQ